MGDYYGTVAQILPVLVLALVWDSRYFEGLRLQPRRSRREDPVSGVRFWTLPRVRAYALTVSTVIIGDLAICLLVLAGWVGDNSVIRGITLGGLLLGAATLLWRMWMHIIEATKV